MVHEIYSNIYPNRFLANKYLPHINTISRFDSNHNGGSIHHIMVT